MTDTSDLCQIISVFDPDGDGGDFAYTVGLADRGLPELHVWARPGEGADPGLDWMLSPRDRHALLMEFAEDLVAGRITVGCERTHVYDDGLATAIYRLDDPVEADTLEAFGAAPAPVIPIRWRLERPPAGLPVAVDSATDADIRERADIERWFTTVIAARSGRTFTDRTRITTRHDQELGPQRAVVRAVGDQLRQSTAELVAGIGFTMFAAQRSGWADGYDRALLAAHARVAGRLAAYDEARVYADVVVGELLGTATAPTTLLRDALASGGAEDEDYFRSWLIDSVGRYARTTLSAEAVADVVPDDLYWSATTVRDVLYADREVRPLPDERLTNPLVQADVARRIGRLSAADLKPVERALADMSQEERAEFSDTLLAAACAAARDRRALPCLDDLLARMPAGARLWRQRRTLHQRFADGLDITAQRRRYRALVDSLDALAAIATWPDDDEQGRDALLAPVPAALLERIGRVDVASLNARWEEIRSAA